MIVRTKLTPENGDRLALAGVAELMWVVRYDALTDDVHAMGDSGKEYLFHVRHIQAWFKAKGSA